jgi:hypothetical protein
MTRSALAAGGKRVPATTVGVNCGQSVAARNGVVALPELRASRAASLSVDARAKQRIERQIATAMVVRKLPDLPAEILAKIVRQLQPFDWHQSLMHSLGPHVGSAARMKCYGYSRELFESVQAVCATSAKWALALESKHLQDPAAVQALAPMLGLLAPQERARCVGRMLQAAGVLITPQAGKAQRFFQRLSNMIDHALGFDALLIHKQILRAAVSVCVAGAKQDGGRLLRQLLETAREIRNPRSQIQVLSAVVPACREAGVAVDVVILDGMLGIAAEVPDARDRVNALKTAVLVCRELGHAVDIAVMDQMRLAVAQVWAPMCMVQSLRDAVVLASALKLKGEAAPFDEMLCCAEITSNSSERFQALHAAVFACKQVDPQIGVPVLKKVLGRVVASEDSLQNCELFMAVVDACRVLTPQMGNEVLGLVVNGARDLKESAHKVDILVFCASVFHVLGLTVPAGLFENVRDAANAIDVRAPQVKAQALAEATACAAYMDAEPGAQHLRELLHLASQDLIDSPNYEDVLRAMVLSCPALGSDLGGEVLKDVIRAIAAIDTPWMKVKALKVAISGCGTVDWHAGSEVLDLAFQVAHEIDIEQDSQDRYAAFSAVVSGCIAIGRKLEPNLFEEMRRNIDAMALPISRAIALSDWVLRSLEADHKVPEDVYKDMQLAPDGIDDPFEKAQALSALAVVAQALGQTLEGHVFDAMASATQAMKKPANKIDTLRCSAGMHQAAGRVLDPKIIDDMLQCAAELTDLPHAQLHAFQSLISVCQMLGPQIGTTGLAKVARACVVIESIHHQAQVLMAVKALLGQRIGHEPWEICALELGLHLNLG